jgi:aspartate/methionine/tyrosine aminotransferase
MIFDRGRDFRKQYVSTIAQCRDAAVGALDILKFSATRGGFYLTIPIDRDEDETTMQLLEQENILVHPGYFYDIDGRHIVTTFIHNPDEVRHHFETIARFLHSVNAT